MWKENTIYKNDLEKIAATTYIPWEKLHGKTLFITGATGLIGYTLASALLYYDKTRDAGIRVLVLARDVEKAKRKYAEQLSDGCNVHFVSGNVENLPSIEQPIDYVIHGASPTASVYFVQKPVETIMSSVCGTNNALELARQKSSAGFVFLSSMEVYGAHKDDEPVLENSPTFLDTATVRNCYPIAKQLCENLCASYAKEYGVNAMSVRLAQTFGPGVRADDKRVFAQFALSVINKQNIVLQTRGESKHAYLYSADAATALLTVLLRGKEGQVYNAANPATYCSIRQMAEMVAHDLANDEIDVEIRLADVSKYPSTHCLNLDSGKLMSLGWRPATDLPSMYRNLIEYYKNCILSI